jgi:uncharacterized membrane protein
MNFLVKYSITLSYYHYGGTLHCPTIIKIVRKPVPKTVLFYIYAVPP